MDAAYRKITKIAREIEKFTARTIKADGVGTAEFDLISLIRKNPGITQSEICCALGADKGAIAKQTANLEAKGYLNRKENPADRRSQLIFPTERAKNLKNSKTQIEAAFYTWLAEPFSKEEWMEFTRLLDILYQRCRVESEANFPNITKKIEAQNGGEVI